MYLASGTLSSSASNCFELTGKEGRSYGCACESRAKSGLQDSLFVNRMLLPSRGPSYRHSFPHVLRCIHVYLLQDICMQEYMRLLRMINRNSNAISLHIRLTEGIDDGGRAKGHVGIHAQLSKHRKESRNGFSGFWLLRSNSSSLLSTTRTYARGSAYNVYDRVHIRTQ